MNSSKLSLFCDRFLEAGWLIGVTVTPVFFNVYSSRVFEPDKLTTLRALAVIMAIVWLVRFVEELLHKEQPLRFSWRAPMVLPALVTMVVYLISSFFSLVPYTSFVGSYQRLQGTFTWFGYLVIFFAMLTSLRTRVQLSRLITVLILNSLPVSLYGIIQHNGLDPLPWAGDVQKRVASNMGNAIFVAAYLIMVVPLIGARIIESFRDILRREEARLSDIFRASSYIFILAVNLLTIWYAKSRGPWLGIVVAGFFFPFLLLIMLQRQTVGEETEPHRWTGDLLRGLGMGLGSLSLLAALGGATYLLTLLSQDVLGWSANIGLYVGGGLMLLVFGGLWLYFVVERKGWRWLWIGWATIGVVAAIGLLAINLPGPLKDRVGAVSSLKRMTTILEWDTGTGRVRTLIWEGALDLIMPHEPIEYPDGSKDTFNAVRPFIGYGPEAMYVGYNSFYPPLLGHYESRNASPDRSHNETLDSVVITGVLGLAAYLFLFGSFFYWCLHWLGLIRGRRQFWIYVALISVISLALFIAFALMDRLYFFAVAIPIGVVAGTTLYIIGRALSINLQAARTPEITESPVHPHSVLLIAIFSSVLAHFVEINFGIAIAATRTTFWALAGMLVVLGLQWLPAEEVTLPSVLAENEKTSSRNWGSSRRCSRKPRSRGSRIRRNSGRWVAAVVSLSLAATFLLGTLAYDFITNPDRLTEGSQVFWRSFTEIYTQGRRSYGALMIVVFTWILFGVVGLGELDREGLFEEDRSRQWWVAVLTYGGLSLFGFLIVGSTLAGFHARLPQIQVTTVEGLVEVATILSGVLGQYYGLIFTVAILLAFVLMWEVPAPRSSLQPVSLLLLPVLLFLGVLLIRNYSYDLIRADIVFKQGTSFANSSDPNQKQIGIKHFDQAIEFAPHEDYYRLFLGKAYLETAQTLPPETDVAQRERIFQVAEEVLHEAREIAPLNTDHSANLARFYNILVSFAEGPQERQELYEKSEENYRKALTLSPNNVVLWNELARLKITQGDEVGFRETISHSLALDPEFEQTWALLGEVRLNQQDLPGAIEAYEKAVAFKPKDCQLRHTLGSLLVQEGRWDDAATALEPILDRCPRMGRVWDVYRLLAISYFYQGRQGAALQMASQSLQLVPEDQRHIVEQLIAAIEQPQPVEPVEPQPAEPESTEPSEP